jgi:hypothetical protein
MIVAAEHLYQGLLVFLRSLHKASSFDGLLLPMIQSLDPPHDAVIGRERSLFGSALDAQDGMSVSSTEVENQFNDFSEGDCKLAVLQDDDADVYSHGLMVTSLMHLRWKIMFFPLRRS